MLNEIFMKNSTRKPHNYHLQKKLKTLIHRLLLSLSFLSFSTLAQDTFVVSGSKIFNPNGYEFIPMGANLFPDNHEAYDSIANCWEFNTVRINHFPEPDWHWYSTTWEFDLLESTFADQKIVVILDLAHDSNQPLSGIGHYWANWSTEGMEEYSNLIELYSYYADRYKDNPYIWLELVNEPGTSGNMDSEAWVTLHQDLIQAIRATGNKNPILVNGWCWGQDACNWTSDNVTEENSAILSLGDQLLTINGEAQDNIIFTHHVYDQFQYADKNRLENYHDDVLAKDYALIVGEYGAGNINDTMKATSFMFDSVQTKNIGRIVWHWSSRDTHGDLTTNNELQGGGDGVDSCTNPTNLSPLGTLVWDDVKNHQPPALPDTTIRIKNRLTNNYLRKNLTNTVKVENLIEKPEYYHWDIVDAPGPYVFLKTRLFAEEKFLRQDFQSKNLRAIPLNESSWGFYWSIELNPVQSGENYYVRFKNRLSGQYLRTAQNKDYLYATDASSSWGFDWIFETPSTNP